MQRALVISAAAGVVAGVLDLVYAMAVYGALGVPPVAILQSIASGLLGPNAYHGGHASALLGGTLHFAIAIAMAGGYLSLYRGVSGIRATPLLAGLLYGLLLFLVMYLAVVPLSASPVTMPEGWLLAGALFAHIVLVGLPIALVVRSCGETRQL